MTLYFSNFSSHRQCIFDAGQIAKTIGKWRADIDWVSPGDHFLWRRLIQNGNSWQPFFRKKKLIKKFYYRRFMCFAGGRYTKKKTECHWKQIHFIRWHLIKLKFNHQWVIIREYWFQHTLVYIAMAGFSPLIVTHLY